jgi:predicted RNase H-like HicB family nuclease
MKPAAKATAFDLKVEFDRESGGRWIADIPALPGVMVYGRTRKQALAAVDALALRVIADRLERRATAGGTVFESASLKVKWAKKHIANLDAFITNFIRSDNFHSVSIETECDEYRHWNHLRFDLAPFPQNEAALTIGDVLHNLRSALDLLWYEIVLACDGVPTRYTRFPVTDNAEKLMVRLESAAKKNQITPAVRQFILEGAKPYAAGNYLIWALDDLNIRDKHKLLVPVLKLVEIRDISLENEKGVLIPLTLIIDESCRLRIREADDMTVTPKHKGHATGTVLFDIEVPFEAEAVIPTLHRIADETQRIIDAAVLLFP